MNSKDGSKNGNTDHIAAQTFTFRELATATRNFRAESLLGEGGFGRVYKGRLENASKVRLVFEKNRRNMKACFFFMSVFLLHIRHTSPFLCCYLLA